MKRLLQFTPPLKLCTTNTISCHLSKNCKQQRNCFLTPLGKTSYRSSCRIESAKRLRGAVKLAPLLILRNLRILLIAEAQTRDKVIRKLCRVVERKCYWFQHGDYQIQRGQFLTSGILLMTFSLLLQWLPNRRKVTTGRRELRNEEFHNLHSSQDIISMMKSRRVRLVGYVAFI